MKKVTKKGFTLIEILIVIAILTVLFTIALIAINPQRQSAQARNTKRRNDVTAILDAIGQYTVDNRGQLPAGITTSAQNVSSTGSNLCAALVTRYLAALPVDPQTNGGTAITDCVAAYDTNYTVVTSPTDNRVTVSSPGVELGAAISVTR